MGALKKPLLFIPKVIVCRLYKDKESIHIPFVLIVEYREYHSSSTPNLVGSFKKGNPENLDSKFVKLGTSFGAIGTFKNNLSDYISESEGTSKEPKAPLSETEKAINSVARAIEGLPLDEAQKLIVAIGIGALAKNVK